jgi:peptide/nickel transport system substrate-binding protein
LSNYSNPEIDALLEAARVELDPEHRLAAYKLVEEMLLADYAAIPLRHGVSFVLVNPRIQGYYLSPLSVAPYIHLLSIATPE